MEKNETLRRIDNALKGARYREDVISNEFDKLEGAGGTSKKGGRNAERSETFKNLESSGNFGLSEKDINTIKLAVEANDEIVDNEFADIKRYVL